jgi:hypothetical protein
MAEDVAIFGKMPQFPNLFIRMNDPSFRYSPSMQPVRGGTLSLCLNVI